MTLQEQSEGAVILRVAMWFGLVTGLVEGLGLWLLQVLHWQTWRMGEVVTADIIWISTVFDFLLFSILAVLLLGVGRLLPRLPLIRWGIGLFGFVRILRCVSANGADT